MIPLAFDFRISYPDSYYTVEEFLIINRYCHWSDVVNIQYQLNLGMRKISFKMEKRKLLNFVFKEKCM